MATPLPPLPGETPEQRRARLSAADAVQARIDAQRQAELEAQAEARRKEMQALIDNMLRSAYVLPPLPQLPAPMPEMMARVMPPVDPGFVMDIPTFQPPVRDTTPDFEMQPPMPTPAPMLIEPPVRVVQPKTTSYVPAYSPLKPPPNPGELGYVPPMPVDPGFVMDIPTFRPPVMPPTMVPPPLQNLGEVLQRIQQKQPQVMPPVDPGFVIGPREPVMPPVQKAQLEGEYYVPAYSPKPPAKPGELGYLQPPMPVDPGFVMDIPTFRPPMPEIPNVGLIDNRIGPGFGKPMQPTPSPIDNMSSSILDALRQLQPSAPGNTDYGQPAQPSAGMGLSRLAPPEPYTPPVFEPYTPPMAEPYTPPSMQFSVDMPRMDYARDLYGVNPDNVSMLKRGGLAVKPKKGKC